MAAQATWAAGLMAIMPRTCLLINALAAVGVAMAQPPNESLTPDFASKSAKERSRIAAKEDAEARSDADFQHVMEDAERLFRTGDFDASLERFMEARSIRPYNVYPKVKIQDLQALIAKRDAALAGEVVQQEPPAPEVQVPATEPVVKPEPKAAVPAQRPVENTAAPEVKPSPPAAKVPAPPVKRAPVPAREQPAPREPVNRTLPDEPCTMRVFREGTFLVTERACTGPEGTDIYRRVVPHWGATTHFKNGTAIPERMWWEAFPER